MAHNANDDASTHLQLIEKKSQLNLINRRPSDLTMLEAISMWLRWKIGLPFKEQRATSHSNADADGVIRLWNSLAPFDQAPSKFRDNLKQQLIKAIFKAPKSTRVDLVPGVQSVKG